jgi:hypothetical protein
MRSSGAAAAFVWCAASHPCTVPLRNQYFVYNYGPEQKPATLEEAVEHLVAVRLEAEKKVMAAEYAEKEVSTHINTGFSKECFAWQWQWHGQQHVNGCKGQ